MVVLKTGSVTLSSGLYTAVFFNSTHLVFGTSDSKIFFTDNDKNMVWRQQHPSLSGSYKLAVINTTIFY